MADFRVILLRIPNRPTAEVTLRAATGPMKLSRFNSQQQGENNRETCATRARRSRTIRQYSRDSNRSQGRWRRTGPPVAAPNFASPSQRQSIVHQRSANCDNEARRSYKNRTRLTCTLRPAAGGIIVLQDRHAAGALIPLELPLGCAKYISFGPWRSFLWRRGLRRQIPLFSRSPFLSAASGLVILYVLDVVPSVSAAGLGGVSIGLVSSSKVS